MKLPIIKIAIIGPESTGKSKLCIELSAYYNTIYVEEFARKYLLKKNNIYSKDDLLFIAKSQLENELFLEKRANKMLFIDNDFINLKIWMKEVFKEEDSSIKNLIKQHRYDLYLLCDIDIKWEKDFLRNNEHNRAYLYNCFETALIHYQLPYLKVSGLDENRTLNAIQKINLFFNLK